ncbi:hypothetical protein ACROYT_G032462 [Oculina patagonica]
MTSVRQITQSRKVLFLVHSTARDLGDCAKLCCRTGGCEVALLENGTCYSLNCHGNLTCPTANLSRGGPSSSRSLIVIKDLLQPETRSERAHAASCDFSNVLHEVVLRGGSQSGKFKFLTEVDDMDTCIRECCRHKVCDLALMLKDNCFLVSCHNEVLCDPIPSRSSDYHPQIAYKVKHGKRRHVEIRSRRDRKNSPSKKHIQEAARDSNTENATFTMGRFFPVSSVKVRNIHSNGSGFVDIANNSKADEEMTSNDTVLVSNETETDIFANETTPQYVLMSQPLLTLNDSRSVLGGKSTLVLSESSVTVKKTVLLSKAVKNTKTQTLATVARTVAVDSSEVASMKRQSIERLKTLNVLSSHPSQTVKTEALESVIETSKTANSSLQSEALQVPSTAVSDFSEQVQKSNVQASPVVISDSFNVKSGDVQTESVAREVKSLNLQSQISKRLKTSSAVTLQNSEKVQTSQISASPLVKGDFSSLIILSLNSPLGTPRITEKILSPSQNELETIDPVSSSSRLDKPFILFPTLEATAVEKSSRADRTPQIILSVSSAIPETRGFSSNVDAPDEHENGAVSSSNILGRLLLTVLGSSGSLSVTTDVATQTSVLPQSTISSSLPKSLSRLETPTSLTDTTGNHVQSLSLASESEQHQTQTPEEAKSVTEGLFARSFVLPTKEIATSSINNNRPDTSAIILQKDNTATGTLMTILESEKPSNSANLNDTGDSTPQTGEDISSSSVSSEELKQNQNVDHWRTFSFVLPTPSATARVVTKEPENIKASSSPENTQSSGFARMQEERDEIPVVTPRLIGLPSLSDISPSETHSSTSVIDPNSSGVLQENEEKSNSSSISATSGTLITTALSSQTLAKSEPQAVSTGNIHAVEFSSLSPAQSESHASITETFNSMALLSPPSVQGAQSAGQVMIQGQSSQMTSKEADRSFIEADSSKKAFRTVETNDSQGTDSKGALSPSTQQASSNKPKASLTVVTSGSKSLAPSQSRQFLSTTPAPSLQQGVVSAMSAVATSTLSTRFNQEKSDAVPAAVRKNVAQVSISTGIQDESTTNLQQGIAAELSFLDKWPVEPTPNSSLNHSSATTRSVENNAASSSGVSQQQYISTPSLIGLPSGAQISTKAVISPSGVLDITGSLESLTPEGHSSSEASSPESSVSIKASFVSTQLQALKLTVSPKQSFLESFTRQMETAPLSPKRLGNTSSAELDSVLVSLPSTKAQNSINTENLSSSIRATTDVFGSITSGTIATRSVTITSTSAPETLADRLGKLHVQEKEKVVRTLASGIVSSPVFNHAIRHIGDLLKNESGLMHSVSRLESMLGHLQGLLVRETRNHLKSSPNVSLPLVETVQKGNSSGEISKQVGSKLDGISKKLKRISSVLSELQIKRRGNNSTLVAKSNIEQPGNVSRVDEKHNRLIELLLKRFNKLEAAIQRKRDFDPVNTMRTKSVVSVKGDTNAIASVIQHSLSEGSGSMTQSDLKALRISSVIVPSSNAATTRRFSHVSTQRIQMSANVLRSSKPFAVDHSSMKSTISLSSTRHTTQYIYHYNYWGKFEEFEFVRSTTNQLAHYQ